MLTTNNGKLLDDNVYWLNQKEWDGKVLANLPVSSVNVSVKNFTKKTNHYEGRLIVKKSRTISGRCNSIDIKGCKN